jgi:hypothetical protein
VAVARVGNDEVEAGPLRHRTDAPRERRYDALIRTERPPVSYEKDRQ